MDDHMAFTRQAASDAVGDLGWRFILGTFRTSVRVGSLARAAEVATHAVAACGPDADGHLWTDLRADRVLFTVQSLAEATVTPLDAELARRVSSAVAAFGLRTEPAGVQLVEVAIDALDIPAVRPFWKALLAYVDEPGRDGPSDAIVDPLRLSPAIWFQQMDAPRPQRNRIHVDLCVPHDEARQRMDAALAAGGRIVSDAVAPAFWVLADAEGNEACITTWQGRD